MNIIFYTAAFLVFILLGSYSFTIGSYSQTGNSIVFCDTTKIVLNNSCIIDTLVGKSVVRISLENSECEKPTIKEIQIIFLSIVLKDGPFQKLFDYRRMVAERLSESDAKVLTFYTEELSEVLKKRGVCCIDKNIVLDNDKYDFPITFIVNPSE